MFSAHSRTKSYLFLQCFYYSLKAINTPFFILFGELPRDSCRHFVFPDISLSVLTAQGPRQIPYSGPPVSPANTSELAMVLLQSHRQMLPVILLFHMEP